MAPKDPRDRDADRDGMDRESTPQQTPNPDRDLFQSVISGTVADILSPELGEALIAAYERAEAAGDTAMLSLAEQALDAYEQAELAQEVPQ